MNKKCFSIVTLVTFCIGLVTLFHMRHSELMNFNGRTEVWSTTWNAISHFKVQHKFFGSGIGTYKAYYPVQFEPKITMIVHGAFLQAHNDLLQSIFELGWVGFSIIAVALIKLFHIAKTCGGKWRIAACSIFFVLFYYYISFYLSH